MKQLKHPNILPLYAAFLEDDQLWMVRSRRQDELPV